jgi:flagellin-like protein
MRVAKRRGVSEILAAIIMIALTLTAFALIGPELVSRTQQQATDVANQYQQGTLKLGELLSAVYHDQGSSTFKVGLYNYGTQGVTPLYVFISTGSGQCKGACACSWSLSPSSPITPGTPVQLDVGPCTDSGGNPVTMSSITSYQLLLYSTDSLGYTFEL